MLVMETIGITVGLSSGLVKGGGVVVVWLSLSLSGCLGVSAAKLKCSHECSVISDSFLMHRNVRVVALSM